MAIVADAARPIIDKPTLAMDAFTQPTPRDGDWNRPFSIIASTLETHIPFAYQTPVVSNTDAAAVVVDYDLDPFHNASTPATDR